MNPLVRAWLCIAGCLLIAGSAFAAEAPRQPNVLVIMTDDQGWGDFSLHGNPRLKTPHIDRLAAQGIELTQFYVSPVCTPTRASLMTGRYNYRTGAIDTYLGRATMVTEELTLAEILAAAGYRTGIFGKWHLGDNYPSRPMDQGFQESLVHRGGGIGQPSDPPGNRYQDPELLHNGRPEKSQGYCSNVFTDAAIRFISEHRDVPTFTYLAFNCPHTPLEVPDEYHARYRTAGLDDATARVYGMISNIDDNLGRLFEKLAELHLDTQTIVVFLTDNGPQQRRYNGEFRDLKGSVYEGGIHVPCLIRWPSRLAAGGKHEGPAAHIDLVPTLLAACNVRRPDGVRLDGQNLLPQLMGQQMPDPQRLLFFQWHRGDEPQKGRACAIRGPRFKLVQAEGRGEQNNFQPKWELFDLQADPGEQHNVIDQHSQLVDSMRAAYDAWFVDVSATRGYPVPKIVVGTEHENPVTLTRQDWRGDQAGWGSKGIGHWTIDVPQPRTFRVTLRITPAKGDRKARLKIGDHEWSAVLVADTDQAVIDRVELPRGSWLLSATIEEGGRVTGAHYVDLLADIAPAAK